MSRSSPPSYLQMVLMLGLLACIAPATIDAYLPAFGALEREFGVPPEAVQQTLGVYMLAYASMLLLHGTLSDAWGRRPVILASLAVYLAGSLTAALAPSLGWLLAGRVLQGLSAGAGLVVGQAIVRDCYDEAVARRTLSYIVMVFNVSPALAPLFGGQLTAHYGWRAVFLMLAALALGAWLLCGMRLPETLPAARRQPLAWHELGSDMWRMLRNRSYMGMTLVASLLVAGQAFLIGGAPDFIVHTLNLPETAFAVLFVPLVAGAMAGALAAASLSARWDDSKTLGCAYLLMLGSCLANTVYLFVCPTPALPWAVLLPAVFTGGLAMAMPALTLRILAHAPRRAGLAASFLGFFQMAGFSAVSGWCVPWIYGQPLGMALAMLACVIASVAGWGMLRK
ncbi:multidrug effflux MFS transporter [Kerstersia sp.]|uniref:multidrug effflux MFS transporter n=1 Tax=Kerstersia sp. TaxID=1930783 RepID=UPI003F8FE1B4